ncbi:penicillin-binding transpeptidase domain-containing protein, partial [Desulfovibrio desulfuricans]|nr:penicillin-binding transpeptidase domain-containing protein [Desulfovibrio desulfuricans]
MDENGDLKDTVAEQKAKDGQDIRTTIDIDAQKAAYEEVKNDAGSAVVMNSHTGEMLAMVSMPAYDPNDFAMGMDTKTWDSLNN